MHALVPASGVAGAPAVEIVTPAVLLADPQLCAEWDALARHASEPNPFAERWYLDAALQALDRGNVQLAVVRDQALVGLMPLVREGHYARLPLPHKRNWLNHNAFLGMPLVRAGYEEAFWAAILKAVDGEQGAGLFLHVEGLPIASKITRALEKVCAGQNRRCALVHGEERALLEHGLSPQAYLEAHVRGKKRKELRRQHKRLAELGELAFVRSDGSNGLGEWTDEFLALERRGWKGTNGSALDCSVDTRQLFCRALAGAAKAGRLELLALRLDGRAIAMLVNFITPPGAFSFKTAFDEDYARFSPGVLLQLENLKLLDRADIAWCDSCAAQDHPMIDSIWSGRRAIGRYSVAVGGWAKRAAFAALLAAEQAKARLPKMRAARPQAFDG